MVDSVVFDVGRVLYRWDLRCLFGKLIDDPERLEWFVSTVVTEQWHADHDAGCDLAEMVAERTAQFPKEAHLIEAYATRFPESIPGPVPGSIELVEQLDAAGVPLFAITNFAATFWAQFRPTAPVFDRFRDIVVSGVEKLAKPDPAIFDLAAWRFAIDPARALFIDDNAANIAAAQQLGWQVHHFRDAPTLAADLTERGLVRA